VAASSSVEAQDEFQVSDNDAARRFELHVGEALAGFTDYHAQPGLVTLMHTEIDPAFEGQGLGSRFVAAVLEEIRARGSKVLPVCPFVRAFFERHPDYRSLLWTP